MKNIYSLFAIPLGIITLTVAFVMPMNTKAQTVSANPSTISSGQSTTLSLGTPVNTVLTRLYISCPVGISATAQGSLAFPVPQNLCNQWVTPNVITSPFAVNFVNNTASTQNVVPNFYVASASNPNYLVGATANIQVMPYSGTTTPVNAGVAVSNESWTISPPVYTQSGPANRTTFSGSFTVTAGNNSIFLSRTPFGALSPATNNPNSSAVGISVFAAANGAQASDRNDMFAVNSGQSRVFNVAGILTNNSAAAQTLGAGITTIYYSNSALSYDNIPIDASKLIGLNSDFHSQVLLGGNQSTTTSVTRIVASLDSSSPFTQTVQTSASSVTSNVPLAVFDLTSQNGSSTLKGLVVIGQILGTGSTPPPSPSGIFNSIQLQVGNQTYYGTISSNATISFGNLNVPLPANQAVPLKVMANIAPGVSNVSVQLTLVTQVPSNIAAVNPDGSPTVVQIDRGATASVTTFTQSNVVVTNTSVSLPVLTPGATGGAVGATVTYTFTATAGNTPIYLSTNPAYAVEVTTNAPQGSIAQISSPTALPGDPAGAFLVPAGGSRTFSLSGVISNVYGTTSIVAYMNISAIHYSTSPNITAMPVSAITSGLSNLRSGLIMLVPGSLSQQPWISNTGASLGAPVVQNNVIQSYPATFAFTLTAGNNPIYLNMNPNGIGQVPFLHFATTLAQNDMLPSLHTIVLNPSKMPGDGIFYWMIPANTSRSFTINASLDRNNAFASGVNIVQLDSINYGLSPSAPTTASIYSNLVLMPNFAGNGSIPTSTPTTTPITNVPCPMGYICNPPGTPPICPAGYTCTPVTYNCPSGYTCYTMAPTTPTPVTCPPGYTCVPVNPTPVTATCPVGYICTSTSANTSRVTATPAYSPYPTVTPYVTYSPTPTATATVHTCTTGYTWNGSYCSYIYPSVTPSPTYSTYPTVYPTVTYSPTPTYTYSPTPTPTYSYSASPSPTYTYSPTPTYTYSASPTHTASPSASPAAMNDAQNMTASVGSLLDFINAAIGQCYTNGVYCR